jgi:hypothetical protein
MARNGYAEDFDLVEVIDGHLLVREAAYQMRAILAAFWREIGERPKLSEAFRSIATQQHYWNTMPAGTAARPGTSNHGLGVAVDVASGVASYDNPRHGIFDNIARLYGFNNNQGAATKSATNPRGEAWHYVYVGNPQIRATGNEWEHRANPGPAVADFLKYQTWQREQADRMDARLINVENVVVDVVNKAGEATKKLGWMGDQADRTERKYDELEKKLGIVSAEVRAPAYKAPAQG